MDQDQFQTHVIDVLARLDENMKSLVGNGQPGRVTKLEDKVEALQRERWYAGGIVTGVSTIIGTIIHFVFKH